MNWIKMECPFCHQRIPIHSVTCPDCRATIPHECGEKERQKAILTALVAVGFVIVGCIFGLIYLILQFVNG